MGTMLQRCNCMKCCYRFAIIANGAPFFVVYEKPKDAPEHVIVRLWLLDIPSLHAWRFDKLDDARKAIPVGLHRLNRDGRDEKQIAEVWL